MVDFDAGQFLARNLFIFRCESSASSECVEMKNQSPIFVECGEKIPSLFISVVISTLPPTKASSAGVANEQTLLYLPCDLQTVRDRLLIVFFSSFILVLLLSTGERAVCVVWDVCWIGQQRHRREGQQQECRRRLVRRVASGLFFSSPFLLMEKEGGGKRMKNGK